MAPPPRLDHVKYVRAKGRIYAYFWQAGGVLVPLPAPSAADFFTVYASLKAAREHQRAQTYSIADACAAFETSPRFTKRKPNTQKLYALTLRRIIRELGSFPLNDLTRPDLQLVLDHAMPGASSHNIFLVVLGLVYKLARQQGRTTLEPTKDFAREKLGAHAAWPEDVLAAGLASSHERTRLAIHLLYFTGQRIGDVMAMRWSDIRGGVVAVRQQKTDKPLLIPIHSALREELAATPKRGLTIITNSRGQPMTAQRVRAELKRHCAAHGQNLVPHGLRKNAVISLLEAGCTVAEVASITGQTYQVVEHYARQVDQERLGRAAIFKLENHLENRRLND
jgi:integrase